MKKFFALILVISLLAFAGSAFASTVGHNQNTTPNTTTTITGEEVTGTHSVTASVIAGKALDAASINSAADYVGKSLEAIISAIGGLSSTQATEIATALKNILGNALQPNTNLTEVKTTTAGANATEAQKLAVAANSINLNANQRAIGVVGAVTPSVSGKYAFAQKFGEALYGVALYGDRNQRNTSTNTKVENAASTTGVEFRDSTGAMATSIPGANAAIPGFVNMIVEMTAGNVYEPVIYTTVESLTAAGVSLTDLGQTVSADANDITYTQTVKKTTNTSDDLSTPGDSSGGCSTGFAALSLAVLGSFIATRKK